MDIGKTIVGTGDIGCFIAERLAAAAEILAGIADESKASDTGCGGVVAIRFDVLHQHIIILGEYFADFRQCAVFTKLSFFDEHLETLFERRVAVCIGIAGKP